MNREEQIDMQIRHWIRTNYTSKEIDGKTVRFSLAVNSMDLIKGIGIMKFIIADSGDIAIEIEADERDQLKESNKSIVFSLTQQWADALVLSKLTYADFDCIVE